MLDTLAGSTTLVNTVTTQLSLRILTAIGPLLVLLWALSPLGGQASLRVMSLGNTTINTPVQFEYMMQNKSFNAFDTADDASELAVVDGLFVASLLSPWKTKLSSVDTWDNVKIPVIEAVENSSTPDTNGWYSITTNNTVYSSLIGMPISNLQDVNVNSTLMIETSYWHLDCPVLSPRWYPPNINLSAINGPQSNWTGSVGMSGTLISNTTWPRDRSGSTDSQAVPDDLSPRSIVYNSWDNDVNYTKTGSICNIYTTYVEAEISCAGLTCTASSMRRSKLPHPPATWTFFDTEGLTWLHFASVFVDLINGHSATATGVQIYFVDPSSPFNVNVNQALFSLSRETYATRFAQLLNTVWAAMMGMYAIPEGLSTDTASQNETTLDEQFVARFANATGTKSRSVQVIECHEGWLVLLSVASLAMVLASLVYPVTRMLSRTPQFLLNVSTMVRDSPHVGIPVTGSTLGSTERARLTKKVRVRFGDVATGDEVGHLAVGSIGMGRHVAKARNGRLYD